MDKVIFLLVLSSLPQLVVPEVHSVTSFRAVVEMVSGDSRIFSGESVRLKCSIPNGHRSSWKYLWFRGSEQLPQHGEHFVLWRAKIQESGKYYCQGVRDTVVGDIHTLQSLPFEVNVDGGYAILHVSPQPSLEGDTLTATCRVRGTPQIHEVILYKDGFEVMRQNGINPYFNLTNLTIEDQGMYSCRASWDTERRTRSVISVDTPLQVVEVVSQPILEIVADNNQVPVNKMKLICHVQYNAHAPAPPIHYYFYKNKSRLGIATSENHDLVKQDPGQYSCKVKVPQLGVTRWSTPQNFAQVTGPQMMRPPTLQPRDLLPLAAQNSPPDLPLPPASEPTAARPSPPQSTATSIFIQSTKVSTQSSDPSEKPSQPAPSTPPTVQPLNQTATPVNMYKESGEMSGDGDWPNETEDWDAESGDWPEESGDWPEGSGGWPEGSGGMP
ncbi:high affinity immunoglobulin gamma Fc receptor I-like [Epinephelus lanceolatus]|uniref:Fc receptor-like A n=1 Tax=Epinephelus lanceolatus TaxID=310571 RepID=UPI001445E9B1|nr:Fc receptor-like A [Epinephelus lanceolatus]